jgi:hypothetical protein
MYGVWQDIEEAKRVALKYWKQGYAVICPHANTAFFDGSCPDEVWLNGDLEILERVDVVVMMQGWEQSVGATGEYDHAVAHGKEIIYDDGL